jgi:hypothetical protein
VIGWNRVEAEHPFFVTELMEYGSLADCIDTKPDEYAWGEHGKTVAIHAAKGLSYLHTRSPAVIHFDVKVNRAPLCLFGGMSCS